MFRFLPYVLKTLWRHRVRSMLTVSGAAVALFVFCFVAALQQGLDSLRSGNEKMLVVFQANKFCPATSHLQQDYEHKIKTVAGVRDVLPIQVFTNNCRASLDVIVFYGVPPNRVRTFRDFSLVEGNWQEFEGHQDAAVVGRAVAKRRGLRTGDKFSIGGMTVAVAGVFRSEDRAEENYIYSHLDFLQRRHGSNSVGTVTQFEVRIGSAADARAVCTAIDEMFRGGPAATDTRPKGVFQEASLADLFELIALSHYLGYACVALMIVLVATTTLMAVQDRVREHAVLQTLGFSGWRVFGLVLTESVLLSAAGGMLGVAAATAVLGWAGLSIGAEAVTLPLDPSLELAALGLALSAIIGVVAGGIPAWQAARAEIVPALRQL